MDSRCHCRPVIVSVIVAIPSFVLQLRKCPNFACWSMDECVELRYVQLWRKRHLILDCWPTSRFLCWRLWQTVRKMIVWLGLKRNLFSCWYFKTVMMRVELNENFTCRLIAFLWVKLTAIDLLNLTHFDCMFKVHWKLANYYPLNTPNKHWPWKITIIRLKLIPVCPWRRKYLIWWSGKAFLFVSSYFLYDEDAVDKMFMYFVDHI